MADRCVCSLAGDACGSRDGHCDELGLRLRSTQATLTRNFVVSGAGTITDVDILIDFSKCGEPRARPCRCRMPRPRAPQLQRSRSYSSLPAPGRYYYRRSRQRLAAPSLKFRAPVLARRLGPVCQRHFRRPASRTVVGGSRPAVRPLPACGHRRSCGAFNGQGPNGTWTLTVQDTFDNATLHGRDPLQYYSATLCINQDVPRHHLTDNR